MNVSKVVNRRKIPNQITYASFPHYLLTMLGYIGGKTVYSLPYCFCFNPNYLCKVPLAKLMVKQKVCN